MLICCMIIIGFCGCTDNTTRDKNKIYVNVNGSAHYKSIQSAVENASANKTIFVEAGVYYEHIVINKSVNLVGEDPEKTIIDGNESGSAIKLINTGRCNITGFTIQNSGLSKSGIEIDSSENVIEDNIFQSNYDGIYANNADDNIIQNNTFYSHKRYGIYLSGSDNCNIVKNQFINNSYGLRIKARHNLVMQNQFFDNDKGLYFCCYAEQNMVYENDFINNTDWNAKENSHGQTWYNESMNKGNYWDDYTGNDSDGDGIGDSPYNITSDGSKQDLYPLINPIQN